MIFTETFNIENHAGSPVKIGNAIMGEDFYLKIADESVYRFLGEYDIFPITKNIHPDYKDEFIEKSNSLPIGGKDFIFLKLRQTSNIRRETDQRENAVIPENQYIPAIIFMEKGYADTKNLDYINIEIYHVLYLRHCAKSLDAKIDKFYSVLSVSDDLYFEYPSTSKKLALSQFKNGKMSVTNFSSIDDFVKKLNPDDYASNQPDFEKLIYDIENFSNSFFHIISSNILSCGGDYEKISIKGITLNKNNDEKTVFGVIKNSCSISRSDIDFLENMANIDSLTGLLNKKAITDQIKIKLNSGSLKTMALVMMDIDYFKDINDTYGHMFGDEVLLTVSRTLKNTIGERGMIGRIGGDEFLIAIENIDTSSENEIRSILRSIRSKIEWSYSGKIKITTSLGTAMWPTDANDYETLLKLSDKCLYIAKEKGRNRFIIYKKEKHGTLSYVDLNSKAISIMPNISTTKKSEHICGIIDLLINSDKEAVFDNIIKMADTLSTYYLFDKCMIFYGDDLKNIYSYNASEEDLKIISLLDKYKDLFDKRNMLIVGNYISMEIKNIDLYNFFYDTKNHSAIQYLIKENDVVKGLIFISTYEHSNKWSDVDINYLAIIFSLIAKSLNLSFK
ncbi:MAG: GGDEF domain-containing protein [Clostridiales bacterium]|nr:GGDEF domain-containing protein [Clostridiales bacterium]